MGRGRKALTAADPGIARRIDCTNFNEPVTIEAPANATQPQGGLSGVSLHLHDVANEFDVMPELRNKGNS
jgi:hypothetical protein